MVVWREEKARSLLEDLENTNRRRKSEKVTECIADRCTFVVVVVTLLKKPGKNELKKDNRTKDREYR